MTAYDLVEYLMEKRPMFFPILTGSLFPIWFEKREFAQRENRT